MYSPPSYISAQGGGNPEAASEAEDGRSFLFLAPFKILGLGGSYAVGGFKYFLSRSNSSPALHGITRIAGRVRPTQVSYNQVFKETAGSQLHGGAGDLKLQRQSSTFPLRVTRLC